MLVGGTVAVCRFRNRNKEILLSPGEFVAVLNGVEFRTRHNDYKLRSSSTSSKNFNAIEDVKFPDVPPQVKNKKTVQVIAN